MNVQRLCFFFVLLAPSIQAQRVWTVGPAASYDFTDIPPAIAAAAPGDTVDVFSPASGTGYSPIVLDKGIRLVSRGWAGYSGSISVRDLPADESAFLVSWTVDLFGSVGGYVVNITNCRGRVALIDCVNSDVTVANSQRTEIRHCDDVVISGGWLDNTRITNSRVIATNTWFLGFPAIIQHGGEFTMQGVRVDAPNTTSSLIMPGYNAVEMYGGLLRVSGSRRCIQGGTTRVGTVQQILYIGHGIYSDGGRVVLGAEVCISPRGGIPIAGTSQFEFHSDPYVSLTRELPLFEATLHGEPGAPGWVLISLFSGPALPTPFGDFWLDALYGTTQVIASGTLDANGELGVQRDYTGVVTTGEVFMVQGMVLESSGGLRLSSPCVLGMGYVVGAGL